LLLWRQEIYFFCVASRPIKGHTEHPIQWIWRFQPTGFLSRWCSCSNRGLLGSSWFGLENPVGKGSDFRKTFISFQK
jgi:hypothetical protein